LKEHEKECLYALTEVGPYLRYPAYLNVSRAASGVVEITVRTQDALGTGMIRLSPDQWKVFKLQIADPLDQS
jgi:hypothetical protein